MDNPGFGWTNFGMVERYSSHRRLIQTTKSWSRIGEGSSSLDAVHHESSVGESLVKGAAEEERTARALMAQMMEKMYKKGWMPGTGGGISMRTSSSKGKRVLVTPSGNQKEDVLGDDLLTMDLDTGEIIKKVEGTKPSACTPLWYVVYRHRPTAMCVIHTHSMMAQMATMLLENPTSSKIVGRDDDNIPVLTLTHLEMLKGVGGHANHDILEIPVIENAPSEDVLAEPMAKAIQKYPKCNAVLVRRHGIFVWGDSWQQAKVQLESFDYLCETAVRMKALGIDPSVPPAYIPSKKRVADDHETNGESVAHPAKKARIETKLSSTLVQPDFNGVGKSDNKRDLSLKQRGSLPLLPRDCRILLLDIEGCTTSISFVKDVLFPYVLEHVGNFLKSLDDEAVMKHRDSLEADLSKIEDTSVREACCAPLSEAAGDHRFSVQRIVEAMVSHDVKATGLKALQGQMWKAGYASGELKGHVYEDFLPFLQWCQNQGVDVHIYSSGSIAAQKLLFGNSTNGDLTGYLIQHFDTTSGGKKEAASYKTIAASLQVETSQICFVSDAEAELVAAREAGVGFVVMSVRSGNAPMTEIGHEFPCIQSLLQLCGC